MMLIFSALHQLLLFLSVACPALWCQATSVPDDSLPLSSAGASLGGLTAVLEDAVSPAFGATVIIMVTVVVSGGAYLCFLRYVCGGCCQPVQVEPAADGEGNKVEEQV